MASADGQLRFSSLPNRPGVMITDPIQDAEFRLFTDTSISLTPASTAVFTFPVDRAVDIETTALETAIPLRIWIRDDDGTQIASVDHDERLALSEGKYSIEFSSAPMKLFVRVTAPLRIDSTSDRDRRRIEFPDEATVRIGARSKHTQPAGTIEVPPFPEPTMDAISAFGSSLKTLSPERSFPTLRGHPPLLRPGSELDIPDQFATSVETAPVTIRVPPEWRYLLPITPLATYLNARVEPGEIPTLEADGRTFGLSGTVDYDSAVAQRLKQLFTLDCIVRTEGLYQVEFVPRTRIERDLGQYLDRSLADLYEAPLPERVATYLDIPWDVLKPAVPTWRATVHVPPTSATIPYLPFLANYLTIIRCPVQSPDKGEPEPDVVKNFYRSASTAPVTDEVVPATTPPAPSGDALVRGHSRTDVQDEQQPTETVNVDADEESMADIWLGDGFPLNAGKPSLQAYHRQLKRGKEQPSQISVEVICNDPEMLEEADVGDIYDTRDLLTLDVTSRQNLTCADLRTLLARGPDFFHYIGHVTAEGLQCTDGYLDIADLEETNIGTFLLNGCRSYRQGQILVRRGAIGGIVSLTRVANEAATRVGRTVARLLNAGWPLLFVLEIVRHQTITGNRYIVIGDPMAEFVHSPNGTPIAARLSIPDNPPTDDQTYFNLDITAYPTKRYDMGTLYCPHLPGMSRQWFNSGDLETLTLPREDIASFFDTESFPVIVEPDMFFWSDELLMRDLTHEDLRSSPTEPP